MGMMFFLEINVMILSPLFVEVLHAVEFRRTLLDLCKDVKHKQGKSTPLPYLFYSGQNSATSLPFCIEETTSSAERAFLVIFGCTARGSEVPFDPSSTVNGFFTGSRSGCATANEIRSNTPALEDKVQRSNILPNSNTHNQNKSLNLHRVSNEQGEMACFSGIEKV